MESRSGYLLLHNLDLGSPIPDPEYSALAHQPSNLSRPPSFSPFCPLYSKIHFTGKSSLSVVYLSHGGFGGFIEFD